ncbi:MAG: S41 family peptidase [Thermoanaerobaculia bacterium]
MTGSPPSNWRKTRVASLLALLMIATGWKFQPSRYDRKAWFADYGYLQRQIGELYANLDWTAEKGSPDLRKLDRDVTAALQNARSDDEARTILRGFVRAFGDGHMSLLQADAPAVDPKPSPDVLLSRFTPPETACEALRFNHWGEQEFPFRLEGTPGFRRAGGANSFASAILDFEGRRFGLVRIGSFETKDFLGACLREWPLFRQKLAGTCERDCRGEFERRVADRLLGEIEARIRQLDHAGSQILIVDLTNNPGGDGWFSPAAQLFSAERLRPLRAAYVKNRLTVGRLQSDRGEIAHYLATRSPDSRLRAILEDAICRLDDVVAEAERPCDPLFIWAGRSRQSGCTRLTTRELYRTGVFGRYEGALLPFAVQASVCFDAVYRSVQGAWHGPVSVLIDGNTASSAEAFAGLLRYRAGALLVGRHSSSCGGGWTFGLRPWTLPESGMQLYMPDTVEYWPDGANAREGLAPDVPTRWRPRENPALMAKQLLKALRSVDFPAASPASISQ